MTKEEERARLRDEPEMEAHAGGVRTDTPKDRRAAVPAIEGDRAERAAGRGEGSATW